MRNVTRPHMPDSLRKNAKIWTDALLKALKNNNDPSTLYRRYKKKDVLDKLKKMYSDDEGFSYCCYCETEIETVSFPRIEHRKPKAKYPESTFEWDNLHLSCERCNNAKGNKYNEDAPILDAFKDIPIKSHLGYKVSDSKGIYRETISDKGITTVEHADLDRSGLRRARLTIYNAVIKAVREIKALDDDPRAYTAKKMLRDKCSEAHGSLIEWALDDWRL